MSDDQWHLVADLCWRIAGTYGFYRVVMDLLAKGERWIKRRIKEHEQQAIAKIECEP